MTKHAPLALPLRAYDLADNVTTQWTRRPDAWGIRDANNHFCAVGLNQAQAKAIVQACNSFPAMLEALKFVHGQMLHWTKDTGNIIHICDQGQIDPNATDNCQACAIEERLQAAIAQAEKES